MKLNLFIPKIIFLLIVSGGFLWAQEADKNYQVSKAQIKEGKIDEALESIEKAIKADQMNSDYLVFKGDILFSYKKDYEGAEKQYNYALRLDKDNALIYHKIALCYMERGDRSSACKYWRLSEQSGKVMSATENMRKYCQ